MTMFSDQFYELFSDLFYEQLSDMFYELFSDLFYEVFSAPPICCLFGGAFFHHALAKVAANNDLLEKISGQLAAKLKQLAANSLPS